MYFIKYKDFLTLCKFLEYGIHIMDELKRIMPVKEGSWLDLYLKV